MSLASRNFNAKQALEKEVKDLYLKFTVNAQIAAQAVADLTADITFTSVALGAARNTNTITIQVAAAAANPTNTILAVFTGTSAAITITITPNDGTNNGATPVNLTTAELRELINAGSVVGKTVTVTDGSSLRALQTATGGGAQNLADGGEGDGVVATFANGSTSQPTINSGVGIASVVSNGVGDWSITLQDAYVQLKHVRAIHLAAAAADVHFQAKSEAVATASAPVVRLMALAAASPVEPAANTVILVKLELKNSTVA